jgi:hypothetical protein
MKKVFGLLLTVATLMVVVPQAASASSGLPPSGFGFHRLPISVISVGRNGASNGSGLGSNGTGTSGSGSKKAQPPVRRKL